LSGALFIVYTSNHTASWSLLWPMTSICKTDGWS
jgi:hypothetical protein